MKKKYEEPRLIVTILSMQNVITNSGLTDGGDFDDRNDNGNSSEWEF